MVGLNAMGVCMKNIFRQGHLVPAQGGDRAVGQGGRGAHIDLALALPGTRRGVAVEEGHVAVGKSWGR